MYLLQKKWPIRVRRADYQNQLWEDVQRFRIRKKFKENALAVKKAFEELQRLVLIANRKKNRKKKIGKNLYASDVSPQIIASITFCYQNYLQFLFFNKKVWKVCPFIFLKGRQTLIRCAPFRAVASFLTQRNVYFILNTQTMISTALLWTSSSFFNSPQLMDIVVYDRPGKTDRFTIVYQFLNLKFAVRPSFSIQVNERVPVPSLTKIFLSAGWLEREVWDMFGVFFTLHGDLRRILTDYGFSGFPLRKDFPLSGFIECYYDDSTKRVAYQNVELSQENRQYVLTSTWTAIKI